jgi:hypothetical protein
VLRLFSPAAFHPEVGSSCTLLGQEHIEREFYVMFQGAKMDSSHEALLSPHGTFWQLSDAVLRKCEAMGLAMLNDLLRIQAPSELQTRLMDALEIYSRATLTADMTEKLVHVLVALESLLLRNSSEPVQNAIAERVAFLTGATTQERLTVAKGVKKAYGLRSRYMHHGYPARDFDTVREFLGDARGAMLRLVQTAGDVRTLKELHEALERRKYA